MFAHRVQGSTRALRSRIGNPLASLGEALPALRPLTLWMEVQLFQIGQLSQDESGQATLSVAMIITGLMTALAILIIGYLIWPALEGLGRNVAADIESAGNWSP